jgi:hypothetical protein
MSSKKWILWILVFFINKKTFETIGEIKFLNSRYFYEGLFIKNKQIRTLWNLKISNFYHAIEIVNKYINKENKNKIKFKRKYYKYLYLILANF